MKSTPLMYVLVMLVAALASHVLVRSSKFIRDELDVGGKGYPTLGGLRGILAMSVFIGHSQIAYRYYQDGAWSHADENIYRFAGTGAVAVFFMITGLLFWGKVLDNDVKVKKLLLSRVRRIMPLYLFSLFFIIVASLWQSNFTLRVPAVDFAYSILLWLAGGLAGNPEINGVSSLAINCGVTWTLQYEWIFYIGLPLLALWSAPKKFVILVTIFFSVLLALKYSQYANYFPNVVVAMPFISGMVTAYILRLPIKREYFTSSTASCFVAGSFVFAGLAYAPGYSTLVAAALLPAFVLVAGGNDVFGLLGKLWIRWLGEISYSVYLMHGLVLMMTLYIVNANFEIKSISYFAYVIVSSATAILVIVFSTLSYVYIERPFLKTKIMNGKQ